MKRLLAQLALAAAALMVFAGSWPVSAHAATGTQTPEDEILVNVRLSPPHYRGSSGYSGSYGDEIGRGARQRIARQIARDYHLTLVTDWPMPLLGVDCFVMRVAPGEAVAAVAAKVSRDANVAWSEPMVVYQAQGNPAADNDPLFLAQPAAREWHLAELHGIATGRGVTVAVIDSRIEARHPDLAGQIIVDQDFTVDHPSGAERHGTGVAGIIAAKANNGLGIAGIAPRARLMALRACWEQSDATVCNTLSLAKALNFAIEHKAQVINLSLGGPRGELLSRLLETGLKRGATIVAAFDARQSDGGFPASQPGVIAVADEALSSVPRAVYTAPGSGIPTTQPGGRWFLVNGSSFAAAHVSGLMALLRERGGSGVAASLVSALGSGGAIDAYATVSRQASRCDHGCDRVSGLAAR